MSAEGTLLFGRYAYPPNELGYCGPAGPAALLDAGVTDDTDLRARQCAGAWAYLEFIAESAGIPDPLDPRVVEAYWLGNDLLDTVDSGALVDHLAGRFRGQLGGIWRDAATWATAHHSFQVFAVYPWAQMLGARRHPSALNVLEQCRIRTGLVADVDADARFALVECRPLAWDGTSIVVGPPRQQKVRWSAGGMALIEPPTPGDRVAAHWDWICDVLTEEQCERVEAQEAKQRDILSSVQ